MLAIALAWYVIRMRGRFAGAVEYAMVLPLGIPGIALGIGILSLWILVPGGIYGTLWILLLAYVTAHIPVAMQFVGSALHRIHTDLEDASRIAGQTWLGTIRRVDIPADAAGADRQLAADVRGDPARDLARDPALQPVDRGPFRGADGRVVERLLPRACGYSLLLLVLGLLPVAVLWKFARFAPD